VAAAMPCPSEPVMAGFTIKLLSLYKLNSGNCCALAVLKKEKNTTEILNNPFIVKILLCNLLN
jgi:hypothetical protein